MTRRSFFSACAGAIAVLASPGRWFRKRPAYKLGVDLASGPCKTAMWVNGRTYWFDTSIIPETATVNTATVYVDGKAHELDVSQWSAPPKSA